MSHMRAAFLVAAGIFALAPASSAQRGRQRRPQELRGSKSSVEKIYDFAQSHHLPFYLTPTNVGDAIASGRLVALTGGEPMGIAVDLRRPPAGPCLTWLRGALTQLEGRGIIEATEERHPVHLHVAVLVPPGAAVVLPQLVGRAAPAHAATNAIANER